MKSKGYSHALYIGEQSTTEREQSKRDFINGDVDVLIASRTIGTGVDSKMYHNGTNTYFENVTGDWYFDNHSNDKDIIFRNDDGSGGVTTYFLLDGSQAQTRFEKNAQ